MCFQVIDKVQEKTGVRLNPRVMMLSTLEQIALFLTQEQGDTKNVPAAQTDSTAKEPTSDRIGFARKLMQKVGLS